MGSIRGIDNETTLDELKLALQVKTAKELRNPVSSMRWNEPERKGRANTFNDFSQIISNNSSYTQDENDIFTNCLERMGIVKELWEELLTIHHRCLCNAYCISIDTGFTMLAVGRGLYIKGSLFNHSCRPNVFFRQKPGTAIIQYITYGTVREDEPLNVAYLSAATDFITRQESLLEEYKFMCKCIRCEEDKEYFKFLEAQKEKEEQEKEGQKEKETNTNN